MWDGRLARPPLFESADELSQLLCCWFNQATKSDIDEVFRIVLPKASSCSVFKSQESSRVYFSACSISKRY
jgi:hypothetical protein